MSVSRREFLASAAALAGADSKMALPTRTLGKTGFKASIQAFGGDSRCFSHKEEDKAIEVVKRALDLGINYIDTSDDYGASEERIGKALKGYDRKRVFLATKVSTRNGAAVAALVERSLKRLGVDQLDLIHIHTLIDDADLVKIEAPGGPLEVLQKMKDQKLTRFIGITSHTAPLALQKALERHDFDCTQMALNAAQANMTNGRGGMVPNAAIPDAFESTALPVAVRKRMGIIAMKIFAQDAIAGQAEATARNLLYYTLSLPVTAAVVGFPKLEHLEEHVKLIKAFKPLPKSEMRRLSQVLSQRNKTALDRHSRNHTDA